jgi:hypothetical protein
MIEEQKDFFGRESIKFNQVRDFGKLLGAPFTFYRQEMKMITKGLLIYAGPFLLISLVLMGFFMQQIFTNVLSGFQMWKSIMMYVGLFLVFLLFAFSMAGTFVNSYVVQYHEKGRDNFNLDDVWEMTKQNFFRILGAQFVVTFIVILGVFLCYIPGIYLQVALAFVYIIMLKERKSFGDAFKRSFAIVKGEWWFTFGLTLVMGMILGFISYIFILPPYIIGIASAFSNSFGLTSQIIVVVFIALYLVFYLFMFAIQAILNNFIYYSILEKKESPGLLNRIQAINSETPPMNNETPNPDELKNRFL